MMRPIGSQGVRPLLRNSGAYGQVRFDGFGGKLKNANYPETIQKPPSKDAGFGLLTIFATLEVGQDFGLVSNAF